MNKFDVLLNRKNTNCIKWDSLKSEYPNYDDIIPMGIADMDFVCDDIFSNAFKKRNEHHIYGYPISAKQIVGDLLVKRYQQKGCDVTIDDLILGTGVVYQINLVINLFTKENDEIILPAPYYTPFRNLIEKNKRKMVISNLKVIDSKYIFDFDDLESKVTDKTKLFILCNPHNPTGRVYSKDELTQVSDFCQKHNLDIISDEIHCDFDYDNKFIPIMSINEFAKKHTFTFSSITKTFNLAGIKASYGFICDEKKNALYHEYAALYGLESINIFGIEALKCAYTEGNNWKLELIEYLRENRKIALDYLNKINNVEVFSNEGTYLLWIDFKKTKIDPNKLNEHLIKYGVQLNDGLLYGQDYAGFQRMNIACPRDLLLKALERIKKAVM